ncbi:hypothetical protein JXQ70_06685 [bacterium]|nr:hypothetical protein [bacterium]
MWDAIFNFYNVLDLDELLEQEAEQLHDYVQDAFCSECGAYYGELESDDRDIRCEYCGEHAVCSLSELLNF